MFALARAALALGSFIFLVTAAEASDSNHKAVHRIAAHYRVSQLYSSRARRRAVTMLQLKLLELHEENLDRLRRIIMRKLPIDTLLKAGRPWE